MRLVLGAVLLALLGACGGDGPGMVAGDVFVVLDNGAELDVVGAPVRVIPDLPSTDTALAALCRTRRDALAAGAPDEARRRAVSEQAWAERARLLARGAVGGVYSAADARFRIDSVPPGRYRVWTDATVQGERWTWREPVQVRGDSAHVSLGNHNADGDPFRCQLLRAIEADSAAG